jgi:uncharacterized protein (DUF305 family)
MLTTGIDLWETVFPRCFVTLRERLVTLRILSVGAGLIIALCGLTACSSDTPPPTNSAPVIVPNGPGEEASTIAPGEATPIEPEQPNDADVTYVREMIVHHQQAIDMAVLAPDRAAAEQVKELASRIAETQGPEIDMMNRWLSQHDKPVVDPKSHDHGIDHADMPGMASPETMTALADAKGAAFDTLFLQTMITHHEGALTMANEVRNAGVDVKIQEWADDVIASQGDEINRMRTMLAG